MSRTIDFDRNEVLFKAMMLFNEKGYAACSIQNLLDIMGLNPSSLYAAFGDKRTLFLEALTLYGQLFIMQFEALLLADDSPIQNIHAFFDMAFLRLTEDLLRFGCFLVNTIAEMTDIDQELVDAAGSKLDRIEIAIENAVKRAQKIGELSRDKDPVAISQFLGSTIKGLRITCKQTQDRKVIGNIIRTALMILDD